MRVEGAELGQGFGVRVYRVLVLGGFRPHPEKTSISVTNMCVTGDRSGCLDPEV